MNDIDHLKTGEKGLVCCWAVMGTAVFAVIILIGLLIITARMT